MVRGTGKTDEDGELTFTDLMLGETYTLHEDRVPGYQPAADKKSSFPRSMKPKLMK